MSESEIDDDTTNGYSGTFRWKSTKKLPILPRRTADVGTCNELSDGWVKLFLSRFSKEEEGFGMLLNARSDMSLIDCLSSPITIANMCAQLGVATLELDKLILLCVGSSAKAEERILRETNCWDEIQYCFPSTIKHIEVWLIGPEISQTKSPFKTENSRISFHIFRGTSNEYFRKYPSSLVQQPSIPLAGSIATPTIASVVIGLNCGFGNWEMSNLTTTRQYDLLYNWLPDLVFLLSTKLPIIFTCANDYADVAGETLTLVHLLGASIIYLPQENPYSYASTLVQDEQSKGGNGGYSRGNSFVYAAQGHDKSRRIKLNLKNKEECILQIMRLRASNAGKVPLNKYLIRTNLKFYYVPDKSSTNDTNSVIKDGGDTIDKSNVSKLGTLSTTDTSTTTKKANEQDLTTSTGKHTHKQEGDILPCDVNTSTQEEVSLEKGNTHGISQGTVHGTAQKEAFQEYYHIEQQIDLQTAALIIRIVIQPSSYISLRDVIFSIHDSGESVIVDIPKHHNDATTENNEKDQLITFHHNLLTRVNGTTISGRLRKKTNTVEIRGEIMSPKAD